MNHMTWLIHMRKFSHFAERILRSCSNFSWDFHFLWNNESWVMIHVTWLIHMKDMTHSFQTCSFIWDIDRFLCTHSLSFVLFVLTLRPSCFSPTIILFFFHHRISARIHMRHAHSYETSLIFDILTLCPSCFFPTHDLSFFFPRRISSAWLQNTSGWKEWCHAHQL